MSQFRHLSTGPRSAWHSGQASGELAVVAVVVGHSFGSVNLATRDKVEAVVEVVVKVGVVGFEEEEAGTGVGTKAAVVDTEAVAVVGHDIEAGAGKVVGADVGVGKIAADAGLEPEAEDSYTRDSY